MMPNNHLSKDVLNVIKKKTGKTVTQKDIQKLASGVNQKTAHSDAKLRQLIKQVSDMVNVPVAESTANGIIRLVKSGELHNLEQIMKNLIKK
ncbi:stage VI sporulation protein F [Paenibacillus agricola]|uniref:Stage VI sporulation protein F n=1 Tax=Paenibacillus agricola TaxID=2716264 RepID=A0ABX0JCK2_9BACL|nr:stage VI sporulation protein F [Paenibacillus agricola]NHN33683.1 hypothetical protein [Paenibacillus agricola]